MESTLKDWFQDWDRTRYMMDQEQGYPCVCGTLGKQSKFQWFSWMDLDSHGGSASGSTWGCFQRGLKEGRKPGRDMTVVSKLAFMVGGHHMRKAENHWLQYKGESELGTNIQYSLLPDCRNNATSCLHLSVTWPTHHNGLCLQTMRQKSTFPQLWGAVR